MNARVYDSEYKKLFFGILILTFLIATGCKIKKSEDHMGVTEELFGYLDDGREVHLYTLSNTNGLEVQIMNFGGIITSISSPDKSGGFDNIVLGFDNLQDYLDGHPYFGALLGRYANRIAKGKFEIDGKEYQLTTNAGDHHIHGGEQGFDKVLWDSEIIDEHSIQLNYLSKDGEEGYPGNLDVTVTYILTNDDELKIKYEATTDKATHVNLSSHSYFNLSSDFSKPILDHHLKLHANQYTLADDQLIPTGEIESVEGTPLDFTEFSKIGSRIDMVEGGYDHNYVLNGDVNQLKIAGEVYHPETGRKLSVYTTEPGLQLYTANFLDGKLVSSDGVPLEKYAGLCLEPQHFPNSPNESNFPSTILRPGETYQSLTVYSFSVE